MKILIVEDQPDKKKNIKEFLCNNFSNNSFVTCSSLRGALKEVVRNFKEYELILLDMSLPSFEPTESYFDDSPESYGGKELMEQMKLRNIFIPIIVVTQYSSFEGGSVSLEGLSDLFSKMYDKFYLGYVYYNSANENWKSELRKKIKQLEGTNNVLS